MNFLVIFLSESIGTFILILIGGGVNASVNLKNTHSSGSGWIVITFGWGFAVMIGAAVATASGGHLNPAVTIAFIATTMVPVTQGLMYLFSELFGAFLGALMVTFLFWDHFKATTENEGSIAGTYYTSPAIENRPRNFVTEIVATFVLIIAVLATVLYANNSGFAAELFGPIFVGFVVVGIGLALGGLTGYAINPARDLMPRVTHFIMPIPNKGKTNWSYSWIPIIGPIIGGLFAAGIFVMAVAIAPNMDVSSLDNAMKLDYWA